MTQARFITFEGGEGSGKTTQARLLAERLRRINVDVLHTREPGGTPRADAIREVLLSGKARSFGPMAETVLFYVARESHLALAIRPALTRGTWVVCDRFMDSTRAYQGAAGGVSQSVLRTLEAAVVGSTQPNLTFIFDIDPESGLQRAAIRARELAHLSNSADIAVDADRFESMSLNFHRSVRDEFLGIAEAEPDRCVVIDASASASHVTDQVWTIIKKRFAL